MQTLQFTRALKEIVIGLRAEELITFLNPLLASGSAVPIGDGQRDFFSELVMSSQVGFARLSEDPQIKATMDAMSVSELYAPQRVGRLIRHLGVVQASNSLPGNPQIFTDFLTLHDALSWLVKLKNGTVQLLEAGKIGSVSPETGVLEVRILDYENTGIEVERVQQFFASMKELHVQLTILLQISDSSLKVLYVDSGTDFYAGFQCAKAVLDIMRGLLSEFWEKFKYSSLQDFDRKIDSLSKGLSFVGAVKEQVDKQAIDEETARNLTYRVLSEMTALVGNGVALPQDQVIQTIDQRKVLIGMRGVKLLGTGDASTPKGGNDQSPASE